MSVLHRRPRLSRRLPVALAAALTVAASGQLTAAAQPTADPVYRAILGVGADETQVNLSWRSEYSGPESVLIHPSDDPTAERRFHGAESDYGALMYDSHYATVTGLQPSTSYTYRIGSDTAGWSPAHTFTTDDFDDDWNFLTYSDAQVGVDLRTAEQGAAWRRTTEAATGQYPDASFQLHLGDQIEGWGNQFEQYDEFFSADAIRNYPTGALNGNHDVYVAGEKHFNEHFHLPNDQVSPANYHFEHNNALFIGLDSNANNSWDIDGHIDYLREIVYGHGGDKDWIIVGFHHAVFSQGSHSTDAEIVRLREQLTPVLSDRGVDLVLNGHDHIYTRSHLMEGTHPVEPGQLPEIGDRLTPVEGQVLYLTSTTASGGKYYDFHGTDGQAYPNLRRADVAGTDLELPSTAYWEQDYTPDYLNIDVSSDELTVTVRDVEEGDVVDRVTLDKSPGSEGPAPGGSGAGSVNLSH